jgi:hypothetical protein
MPSREHKLEANAAPCEFESNLNVEEEEWIVGEWRSLLSRRIQEAKKLDPASQPSDTGVKDGGKRVNAGVSTRTTALQEQALVMKMLGSIHTPNCNFTAALNAAALRTDWDATTGDDQLQFLHDDCMPHANHDSAPPTLAFASAVSSDSGVSLVRRMAKLVIVALFCLAHIYFSLAMQPLFSSFDEE